MATGDQGTDGFNPLSSFGPAPEPGAVSKIVPSIIPPPRVYTPAPQQVISPPTSPRSSGDDDPGSARKRIPPQLPPRELSSPSPSPSSSSSSSSSSSTQQSLSSESLSQQDLASTEGPDPSASFQDIPLTHSLFKELHATYALEFSMRAQKAGAPQEIAQRWAARGKLFNGLILQIDEDHVNNPGSTGSGSSSAAGGGPSAPGTSSEADQPARSQSKGHRVKGVVVRVRHKKREQEAQRRESERRRGDCWNAIVLARTQLALVTEALGNAFVVLGVNPGEVSLSEHSTASATGAQTANRSFSLDLNVVLGNLQARAPIQRAGGAGGRGGQGDGGEDEDAGVGREEAVGRGEAHAQAARDARLGRLATPLAERGRPPADREADPSRRRPAQEDAADRHRLDVRAAGNLPAAERHRRLPSDFRRRTSLGNTGGFVIRTSFVVFLLFSFFLSIVIVELDFLLLIFLLVNDFSPSPSSTPPPVAITVSSSSSSSLSSSSSSSSHIEPGEFVGVQQVTDKKTIAESVTEMMPFDPTESDSSEHPPLTSRLHVVSLVGDPRNSMATTHLKSGWMRKRGGVVKNWKRRFFVLKFDGNLIYSKDEDAHQAKVQGVINLKHEARELGRSQDVRKFGFFIRTDSRTFYFECTSQHTLNDWMDAIQIFMFKPP